jgi:iron complex outermembrane receptor protein
VEQNLWKGAKARATYFENHLDDLIYLVTTSSTTTAINKLYSNVGGAVSRGAELEMEQAFGKFLRLFAAYTYTYSFITNYDTNPALVGKELTQVPRHMINVGIDASYGPASLFVSGRYVAKRYGNDDNSDTVNNVFGSYDPYFVADTKASYKVTDWATLSFSVNNLLNRKYFNYYVAPGRSWFTSLALKF